MEVKTVILGLPHSYTSDRKDLRQVMSTLGIPTAQVLKVALCWMVLIPQLESIQACFLQEVGVVCLERERQRYRLHCLFLLTLEYVCYPQKQGELTNALIYSALTGEV